MGMLKLICDVRFTHLPFNYVPKGIKDTEKLRNTWLGRASIFLRIAIVSVVFRQVDKGQSDYCYYLNGFPDFTVIIGSWNGSVQVVKLNFLKKRGCGY